MSARIRDSLRSVSLVTGLVGRPDGRCQDGTPVRVLTGPVISSPHGRASIITPNCRCRSAACPERWQLTGGRRGAFAGGGARFQGGVRAGARPPCPLPRG